MPIIYTRASFIFYLEFSGHKLRDVFARTPPLFRTSQKLSLFGKTSYFFTSLHLFVFDSTGGSKPPPYENILFDFFKQGIVGRGLCSRLTIRNIFTICIFQNGFSVL